MSLVIVCPIITRTDPCVRCDKEATFVVSSRVDAFGPQDVCDRHLPLIVRRAQTHADSRVIGGTVFA